MLKLMVKRPWSWLWLSAVLVALDQLTKCWANNALLPGQPYPVFPFLNFTLHHNAGAAFSFLSSGSGWQVYFFALITVLVVVALLVWLGRLSSQNTLLELAIALVIGGAIGNLIDRVRLHYVIDFFDFYVKTWHYATFNVADSAVCVGVFLLVLHTFFCSDDSLER